MENQKRLVSDILKLQKNPLNDQGIYHYFDEENIYNFRALFIGPKETPYEGGFYLFEFKIPESYPYDPPKAKYCTQFNNIRYNPNLYTNGTVCLSILNTWSGPSWTPCYSLSSLLVSMIGMIFVQHPLVNEPGHENSPLPLLEAYDNILEHESLRGAVINVIENIPSGFKVFQKDIEQYFLDHYKEYIQRLYFLIKDKNGKTWICPTYNISLHSNYHDVLITMHALYKKISGKDMEIPVILPKLSEINMTLLRKMAEDLSIDVKKKSMKGNMVNKLKNELYQEVDDKLIEKYIK